MDRKIQYTHEAYRTLLREARIWDGTHNCYFCPDCRRHVPKKNAGDPCVFCGSKRWNLNNPLIDKIINTEALMLYMYETFRHCIEPFTTFEIQEWKNGHLLYKICDVQQKRNETRDIFLKKLELWCVSHHGFGGYFLSMCARWTKIFINDGKPVELSFLRYFTFKTPEFFHDYNSEKDNKIYFNMIFDELTNSDDCNVDRLNFKAIDENHKEYDVHASIDICCEAMSLFDDKLLGCLYTDRLLKGSLTELSLALYDFSLIPRCWGSHTDDHTQL